MKVFVSFLFILSGILGLALSLHHHRETCSPVDAPIIRTYHTPAAFVKNLANDKQAGMKIFQEFCAACHAQNPAIDVKAPLIGDKKTWQRLKKLGMDNLLKITIRGAGAMPARGGCFECSDEQLKAAIEYMSNTWGQA